MRLHIINHVVKESCDFVHGDPVSYAITLLRLVVMNRVKIKIFFNFFYSPRDYVTILGSDPFSSATTISSLVGIAPQKLKYNIIYLSRDLCWKCE